MEPADLRTRKPFRFWLTGSLAVVMASLCTGRGVLDDERIAASMRVVHHSPYGVGETLQRIEAAARQRGQAVIVRIDGAGSVLVLASSLGGTPVAMNGPDASPDVPPLSVQVRGSADGGADVLVARLDDADGAAWAELPPLVAAELAALPALLERALS
jgi:hypothetical protein